MDNSLGMRCPRCGVDQWQQAEGLSWNLWECQECRGQCTIQEGVMQIYASGETAGVDDLKAFKAFEKRDVDISPSTVSEAGPGHVHLLYDR